MVVNLDLHLPWPEKLLEQQVSLLIYTKYTTAVHSYNLLVTIIYS